MKSGPTHSATGTSGNNSVISVLSALREDPGFANIVARSSGSPKKQVAVSKSSSIDNEEGDSRSSTSRNSSNSELLKMDVDELLDMVDEESDESDESDDSDESDESDE